MYIRWDVKLWKSVLFSQEINSSAMVAAVTRFLFLAVFVSATYGQMRRDSYGTYFRMVFLDNFVDYPIYRPVDLYVCNRASNFLNTVNVTIPYFTHPNCPPMLVQQMVARSCFRFKLCQEIRHTYADGSLARKVVEVSSNADITVQGFNVEKFSADSYVILPWDLSGLQHHIMSYTLQSIQTQFAIVAREETRIRIVIPDRPGETITVDYNGLRYTNGETLLFNLKPETTFLAQSAGDLTGVMIQSYKKVAVFTGNVRSYNDYNRTSRDHLIEQVPPTGRWGKDFIYVPTPRSIQGDTVKIIALADNTNLNIIGMSGFRDIFIGRDPTVLNLTEVTHLRASQSVLVAVFVRSQDGKEAGISDPADPSMYFLPAITQYHSEYFLPRFKDAEERDYQRVWILVAIPDNSRTISIDGTTRNINGLVKPNNIQALNYIAGVYQVSADSMHRIRMINGQRFMVIAYGASDRESYASTLGYHFDDTGCEEMPVIDIPDGLDNDCDGQVDEELCGDGRDNDGDDLVDEDCSEEVTPTDTGDATGTRFAIVFMTNIVRDNTNVDIDQVELYIAPLERNTTISITAPAYNGVGKPFLPSIKGSVNSVLQIPLNPIMRVTPPNDQRVGQSTKTTKVILVESNKNIVVYGINKKQYSTDGFLALPANVLGSEYYAYCNYPINPADDRCQFAAAAIVDDTTIVIDVPQGVMLDRINGGSPIQGPRSYAIQLNKYEAVEIQSIDDLTGTRVYARDDKHFSFFSGNIRTKVPLERRTRDHLVEQLPSTDTWGSSFVSMPTPRDNDEGDIYKVIAKERNTRVDYWYFNSDQSTGSNSFILNRGEHRTIMLNRSTPISIRSSKPILVIQISMSSFGSNLNNDPSAMVVIPQDRWSNDYKFVTPLSGKRNSNGNQLPFENYILLAVSKEFRRGMFIVQFDNREIFIGSNPAYVWQEMPGDQNNIEGLVFQLPRGQGQTAIRNLDSDATWLAMVFGRANRETYGNPIGLRFRQHDPTTCTSRPMTPGDQIDNDCDGIVDEEVMNNLDDDNDGKIDEDLDRQPTGFRYFFVFEENVVEYPRNYALEIYVGRLANMKITCRMETPGMQSTPSYDITSVVHNPNIGTDANRIQFAVSAALRTTGTSIHRNAIMMTCDHPVTIMGINKETFSSDAFMVLEEQSLGMEYYTVSFAPATIQTQFAVVAVKEGMTRVRLTLKANIEYNDNTVNSLTVNLRQYEVFQAQSDGDLTGSLISANKPVAVFSGNIRTKVALSKSRDHLASQLLPTQYWGTNFHIVPAPLRTVGDLIRVVARVSNTRIRWDRGTRTQLLNQAGDYYEFETEVERPYELTSDRPVLVMQIIKSQAFPFNPEAADPCFIPVVPVRHYVNVTSVVTPLYTRGFYKDGKHYANLMTIILLDGARNGIEINGKTIDLDPLISFASATARRRIDGTNYIAVDLRIQKAGIGTYVVTHRNPNIRFSGYLTGMADRESYCVALGPRQPLN